MNPVNSVNTSPILNNVISKTATQPANSEVEVKKDGNKKLKLALAALATVGITGIGAYMLAKGKSFKLSDVNLNKGIATTADGAEFSGKIKDILKNGDKITLEYKDGILQKSSRTGSVNLEKVYEVINGENVVTKIENGAMTKINTTQLRNEALVKKELIERQKKAKVELARAKYAQEVYNKPFDEVLSGKSAKESTIVFVEKGEEQARIKAQQAQEKFNRPFEEVLSNKSAERSAGVFVDDKEWQEALYGLEMQKKFRKPFEEKLSNKSAKESAEVFLSQQIRPAIVENNGDFRQRLNYIHTVKSSANLDWRIADSLKSLNPKTVDSLSDDFIKELFNIEIDPKVLASNLEFIEVNFSASELEKITKSDTGIKLLLDVLTDKLEEGTELGIAYKTLHKMGK